MIRRLDRYLPLHASYYCVLVEIVNLCVDGAKIRRFSEHIERRPRLLDRGFSQRSTSMSYCSAEPGLALEAYGKNRLRNDALGGRVSRQHAAVSSIPAAYAIVQRASISLATGPAVVPTNDVSSGMALFLAPRAWRGPTRYVFIPRCRGLCERIPKRR